MRETCPTFLVKDGEILEVFYTEWESVQEGQWNLVATTNLHPTIKSFQADLVFELPIGCFYIPLDYTLPGDQLILQRGKGESSPLRRCARPASVVRDQKESISI